MHKRGCQHKEQVGLNFIFKESNIIRIFYLILLMLTNSSQRKIHSMTMGDISIRNSLPLVFHITGQERSEGALVLRRVTKPSSGGSVNKWK